MPLQVRGWGSGWVANLTLRRLIDEPSCEVRVGKALALLPVLLALLFRHRDEVGVDLRGCASDQDHRPRGGNRTRQGIGPKESWSGERRGGEVQWMGGLRA